MVSVIVPVYNCEKTLLRCAESVLGQTYKNIELILVDDGSGDSSAAICDNIAKTDSRVKVIHKKNGGSSSARNCGLDNASGKYIQFVDSDDYIDLNMTEELVKRINLTAVEMVACGHIYTHSNYEEYARFPDISAVSVNEMTSKIPDFVKSYFPNSLWNKLYLKSLIDFRFDENVGIGEDLIFNFNYFKKINKISVSDSCPVHYIVDNPDSLTGKFKPSNISDAIAQFRAGEEFYKAYGNECDIALHSELCAGIIIHSVLQIVAKKDVSYREKKRLLKLRLSNPLVHRIFKNCRELSLKQKIVAYLIKIKFYFALKLLAILTEKE